MTGSPASDGWLAPRALDSLRARLALTTLYSLGWVVLMWASQGLWFLPAGWRLGALWVTPSRHWAWLAVGEWLALAAMTSHGGRDALSWDFVALNMLPWFIYAGVVRLVRGPQAESRIDDPRRMLLLLGSGIASAALVSPVLQAFIHADAGASMAGIFAFIYGDIVAQLVLAPLLVLFLHSSPTRFLDAELWIDLGVQSLLSLTVFWLIRQRLDLAPYLLLLAFAPIFFVAFRRGWEGAAISVALVGALVALLIRLNMAAVDVRALQLALAVVGGGGLVLGAASSDLRRSNERLSLRHRELAQMNRSLTEAAAELRSVSQRLVRLEEQGQRELAGELDYEIGRSIHALSTRISLAFRDIRDEQMLRLLESVREQVREMQESLRRVLRQLRPQVLDTHGLREAIGFGPLRDMLEEAGIGYDTAFYGRVEALHDDAQTTVYRICQAAVREACRSQGNRRVLVRIDVGPGNGQRLEVQIQIDIEASQFLDFPFETHPLAAITDRVLAQQGEYWIEPLTPGVRHKVRFEEDPSALL